MKIKGAKSIAEYKAMQTDRIQKWIDDRFITGSVTWKLQSASIVRITDLTGDYMDVSLDEIE